MADKLRIYKGALRLLGPHELSTLSDDRPERYQLDDAWDDAVEYLLTQGLWNFAIRVVEIDRETSPTPAPIGWDYVFAKPDDWLRTAGISNEATFRPGFEDYEGEGSRWVANVDPLYVRYVSKHTDYGLSVEAWRQPFAKALEAYLAFESGLPISGDRGNRNDLYSLFKERLKRAKAVDAFDESVDHSPAGRLVRSRFSGVRGKDGA